MELWELWLIQIQLAVITTFVVLIWLKAGRR